MINLKKPLSLALAAMLLVGCGTSTDAGTPAEGTDAGTTDAAAPADAGTEAAAPASAGAAASVVPASVPSAGAPASVDVPQPTSSIAASARLKGFLKLIISYIPPFRKYK